MLIGLEGGKVDERSELGVGDGDITVNWRLATELLEHFGRTGESVARFANGDVENEFLDAKLTHWIGALVLLFRLELTD